MENSIFELNKSLLSVELFAYGNKKHIGNFRVILAFLEKRKPNKQLESDKMFLVPSYRHSSDLSNLIQVNISSPESCVNVCVVSLKLN